MIELEVRCGLQTGVLVFVCKGHDDESQQSINITDMLSMAQNDFDFGNLVTCIVHSRFSAFWADYRKLCLGRGYQLHNDNHEVIWHPVIEPIERHQQQCTYINTDLNDFGRGNDLRESPKRTGEPAYHEMVTRLNLPFSNEIREQISGFDFVNLDNAKDSLSLNGALARIFPERNNRRIARFWHEQKKLRVEFVENGDSYEVQHLSLGENEVFFIIAVLLSGKFDNGVAILDEPAGGLAPKSSALFYAELNKIAEKKKIQIFISSHKLEPVIFLKGAKILELKKGPERHLLSVANRVAMEFQNYTAEQEFGLNILKDQIDVATSGIAELITPQAIKAILNDQTSKLKEGARSFIYFLIATSIALLALYVTFISFETLDTANSTMPSLVTEYLLGISILTLLLKITNYWLLSRKNTEASARIINERIGLAIKTNTDTILLQTLKQKIDRRIFEQNHPFFYKFVELFERGHNLTSWTIRKTMTFASFHLIVSFTLVLIFTKSFKMSGGIAVAEFLILLGIYYWLEKSETYGRKKR